MKILRQADFNFVELLIIFTNTVRHFYQLVVARKTFFTFRNKNSLVIILLSTE